MRRERSLRSFFDLELVILLILGAFALAFLIDTRTYNRIAALFPRLVSVVTLLLILAYLVVRFSMSLKEEQPLQKEAEAPARGEGSISGHVSLAIMVGYFVSIFIIGLTWASLLYLLLVPVWMGYRRYRIIAITSVLWIVAFVCIFHYLLHTRIPQGFLGDLYHWIVSR
jgi:Ca2+/Na+ antiporter